MAVRLFPRCRPSAPAAACAAAAARCPRQANRRRWACSLTLKTSLQETVEELKAKVAELEGQLQIAKKVEEVADAMSRLEGMAMQSAQTGAKGQTEVSAFR